MWVEGIGVETTGWVEEGGSLVEEPVIEGMVDSW
jgi:hypothetical protein